MIVKRYFACVKSGSTNFITFYHRKIKCHFLKQIDVSFSCVCPVIDHEFRRNIVKVAVDLWI